MYNRFRWAACQLDTLRKCPSVKKVREALHNLPKTLDETYEQILLNTDEDYRDVIIEALRWLCFSTTTLNIEQLAQAAVFGIHVDSPSEQTPLEVTFDEETLFQDPMDILGLLAGLVVCHGDPATTSQEHLSRKSMIVLSHFSIKEYLVSGRLSSKVNQFQIDEPRAYEILATKSIYNVLYHLDSWLGQPKWNQRNCYRSGDPFLRHASEFWVYYAGKVDHDSGLTVLIISVLELEWSSRQPFLESMDQIDQRSSCLTPLYNACYMGLYWPCKVLLERGADAEEGGGTYGNSLHVSILTAHERIIRLLLDQGAEVNARDSGKYGSAIQGAAATGVISIVKLLLGHGADINTQGRKRASALQNASYYGHVITVQLLLDHGADVNAPAGDWGSALQMALEGGSECITRLLLERGANVNSETGYYDKHFDFSRFRSVPRAIKEALVMILEHGAVVSKFRGGILAEDALARKDFKQFVELQIKTRGERVRNMEVERPKLNAGEAYGLRRRNTRTDERERRARIRNK